MTTRACTYLSGWIAFSLLACSGSGGVSISIQPESVTVGLGGAQSFSATVTGSTNTAASWSVREGSTGGIITSDGVYTAPSTPGTFHVVAMSLADTSKSAAATVTVTTAQVVSVVVTPTSVTVAPNGMQTFTAQVSGAADMSVTWSIKEGNSGGVIASDGTYTASAVAGTFHVVATSVADATKSAQAAVTVSTTTVPSTYLGSPLCLTGDSKVVDRASLRLAERDGLQHPTAPGTGTVHTSTNSAGLLTEWQYTDSAVTLTETYSYDSSGSLTEWQQTWSNSNPTETETFSYDSNGQLTEWQQTWSDSTPTQTETFSYDSAILLTEWQHSWSNSNPTETETFSYDSNGHLTEWQESWSDSTPTITETFSFDTSGDLTEWQQSWSSSMPTVTETFSYNASGMLTNASCTNCSGTPTVVCH